MTLDLTALGITQEELQERVVERLCEQFTTKLDYSYEDGEFRTTSAFGKQLSEMVKKRINEKLEAIAEEHVLPRVSEYVENITLQQTNQWGEAKGKAITFREYLVERAEAYLNEKVDYSGKSQAESGGYSWSGTQTRITHLVHAHLHYDIENAMKQAVKTANAVIAQGIAETVRIKLAEIAKALTVDVKTR